MAKRPFNVSDDEQPVNVPIPTDEELEADSARLIRKFDRKYGRRFPRLLSALRAIADDSGT